MDLALGQLIEQAQEGEEGALRPLRDIGEPTDAQLAGLQGRSATFLAVYRGSELVQARYVILQDNAGTLYLVDTLIPVALPQTQKETIGRVLDSLELGME
jgi:hypothetical protein